MSLDTPEAVKQYDAEWDKRMDAIEKRIRKALGRKKMYVIYGCYPTTKSDLPIDNLDKVAIKGRVRVLHENEMWGNGKSYASRVLRNPTWLKLALIANEAIKVTGDKHHVFFEGIGKYRRSDDLYYLIMGS